MKALIYSSDDRGFYFQRFSDWKTTQVFSTKQEALDADELGLLIWD